MTAPRAGSGEVTVVRLPSSISTKYATWAAWHHVPYFLKFLKKMPSSHEGSDDLLRLLFYCRNVHSQFVLLGLSGTGGVGALAGVMDEQDCELELALQVAQEGE